MTNKFLGMLGLARRAGRAEYGEGRVLSLIRSGNARLVLAASDMSEGSEKKLRNACLHYGVPYLKCAERGELGLALGCGEAAAVAVTDEHFADELRRLGN